MLSLLSKYVILDYGRNAKCFMKQTLKEIMKERREVLSLTQQDLAEMAQVGIATVKDIERGRGNPSLSTIHKILEVLGIEIEYRIRTPHLQIKAPFPKKC